MGLQSSLNDGEISEISCLPGVDLFYEDGLGLNVIYRLMTLRCGPLGLSILRG